MMTQKQIVKLMDRTGFGDHISEFYNMSDPDAEYEVKELKENDSITIIDKDDDTEISFF